MKRALLTLLLVACIDKNAASDTPPPPPPQPIVFKDIVEAEAWERFYNGAMSSLGNSAGMYYEGNVREFAKQADSALREFRKRRP